MFQKLLACLDGSALAEKILPWARALTASKGGKLTLLRIVPEAAALEDPYMRDCARRYGAELRFVVSTDPAAAIGAELEREPSAIAALSTHGRTAWTEAILGSVALRVIRAKFYCPGAATIMRRARTNQHAWACPRSLALPLRAWSARRT
jgi:nucleotide-binding universal stress UspA family protein